jgi:nuclear receptor interaction protein
MTRSLYDRIWRREAGGFSTAANIRGLYGSKEWVGDLDIVNELGGHTGCVNALRYVLTYFHCKFSYRSSPSIGKLIFH